MVTGHASHPSQDRFQRPPGLANAYALDSPWGKDAANSPSTRRRRKPPISPGQRAANALGLEFGRFRLP